MAIDFGDPANRRTYSGRAADASWSRRYADRADSLAEIAERTGRSIPHELTDAELAHLVDELERRLPEGSLVEQDRWTLWRGVRP